MERFVGARTSLGFTCRRVHFGNRSEPYSSRAPRAIERPHHARLSPARPTWLLCGPPQNLKIYPAAAFYNLFFFHLFFETQTQRERADGSTRQGERAKAAAVAQCLIHGRRGWVFFFYIACACAENLTIACAGFGCLFFPAEMAKGADDKTRMMIRAFGSLQCVYGYLIASGVFAIASAYGNNAHASHRSARPVAPWRVLSHVHVSLSHWRHGAFARMANYFILTHFERRLCTNTALWLRATCARACVRCSLYMAQKTRREH